MLALPDGRVGGGPKSGRASFSEKLGGDFAQALAARTLDQWRESSYERRSVHVGLGFLGAAELGVSLRSQLKRFCVIRPPR